MQRDNRQHFGIVAVTMGGVSSEREVSLQSGEAVFGAMQRLGIDARLIDLKPDNLLSILAQNFDRVFNILHGTWGEDGVIQGVFRSMNIPYTGSSVCASAVTMDKVLSKQIWNTVGLPTADYVVITHQRELAKLPDKLGLPLFIKPAAQGSSVGVRRVDEEGQLLDAYLNAAQFGPLVIAEEFLGGAELVVAIVAGETLPIVRIEAHNADFYDYRAKYLSSHTQYFCPCGLAEQEEREIQKLAAEGFSALHASGWGRVDLKISDAGEPMLLEVNTVPGMTSHSLVPMAAAAFGWSFDDLVLKILETTI